MLLINNRLAGKDLPESLPASMIPPSLRDQASKDQPHDATKDLFDIFNSSPPALSPPALPQPAPFFSSPTRPQSANVPAPVSRALSPAAPQSRALSPAQAARPTFDAFGATPFNPQQDLMGDDNLSAPKPAATNEPDRSAEIGNAQNSLASTEKAVAALEKEKKDLEADVSTSSAQLKEIEMRLSSVRAQHDTETRLVNDLKTRVSEQKERVQKLRQDLIQNESDLSGLRAEKDETEQALLADKEEVRELSKKMKEVGEETSVLKGLLEKLKKEARQQKGMVAISKKQVSTAEANRDSIQQEIDQVAADNLAAEQQEQAVITTPPAPVQSASSPFHRPTSSASLSHAAAIPLPSTPQQVSSPSGSMTNQRSNNPFERLGFAARSPAPERSATSSPSQDTPKDEPGLSTLQAATLGVGGAAAAGALVAGSAVGAAVVGGGTAVAAAFEHATDDGKALEGDKTPPAQHQEEPVSDGDKTPAADPSRIDPFTTSEKAMGTERSAATSVTDPFGLPANEAHKQTDNFAGFDDGFGDDFSKGFDSALALDDKAPTPSDPNHEHLPRGLAPSSQTAQDFEEAFKEDEKDVEPPTPVSAVPPGLRSEAAGGQPVAHRSLSTEVFAPTSEVHTPATEDLSAAQSVYSNVDDITSTPGEARPMELDQGLKGPVAPESQETRPDEDSSDEEDLGPEDLDRSRSPYDKTGTPHALSAGQQDPTELVEPSGQLSDLTTVINNAPVEAVHDSQAQGQLSSNAVAQPTVFPAEMLSGAPREDAYATQQATSPETLGLGAPVPIATESTEVYSETQRQSSVDSQGHLPPLQRRREPPPPPTSQKTRNPFGGASLGSESTSENAPANVPAATATVLAPVTARDPVSFDDDFDFEDLQPATITTGPANAAHSQNQNIDPVGQDFDAEFDDFSPDFEIVNKPAVVTTSTTTVQPPAGLIADPGLTQPQTQTIIQEAPQPIHPSQDGLPTSNAPGQGYA